VRSARRWTAESRTSSRQRREPQREREREVQRIEPERGNEALGSKGDSSTGRRDCVGSRFTSPLGRGRRESRAAGEGAGIQLDAKNLTPNPFPSGKGNQIKEILLDARALTPLRATSPEGER